MILEDLTPISPTASSYDRSKAPASMKSIVQSLFLLATALGDLFTGVIFNARHWLGRVELLLLF